MNSLHSGCDQCAQHQENHGGGGGQHAQHRGGRNGRSNKLTRRRKKLITENNGRLFKLQVEHMAHGTRATFQPSYKAQTC